MALKPDIQYVQFYTAGSAAYQIERKPVPRKTVPVAKPRRMKRKVVVIDPVAVCGIVIAVFMLFAMGSGVSQYRQTLQQAEQMNAYVEQLKVENLELQHTYQTSYDPETVYAMATAIGMVPREDAQQVVIRVEMPAEEPVQLNFWDSVSTFLTGLFA